MEELKPPEKIHCTRCGGLLYHPLARMFSPIQIAGWRCRCNEAYMAYIKSKRKNIEI